MLPTHAGEPEFKGASRVMFHRSPYEIDSAHALPSLLVSAANEARVDAPVIGMSFWTDAAVLGGAGIPSVLFGPTGGGLHGLEEWVETASVLKCREALVNLARGWKVSLVAVLTIAVSLFVGGAFLLVSSNLLASVERWGARFWT